MPVSSDNSVLDRLTFRRSETNDVLIDVMGSTIGQAPTQVQGIYTLSIMRMRIPMYRIAAGISTFFSSLGVASSCAHPRCFFLVECLSRWSQRCCYCGPRVWGCAMARAMLCPPSPVLEGGHWPLGPTLSGSAIRSRGLWRQRNENLYFSDRKTRYSELARSRTPLLTKRNRPSVSTRGGPKQKCSPQLLRSLPTLNRGTRANANEN